ncbi:MAG: hypothetical protein JSV91_10685 [Phycisphaerales bacterium]|nr:MAG: hypothetical protein JSV91_10685 [Phycisphaerales bacterium]
MNILADVEQQVQRLRDAQKSHNVELASLAERSRILSEAEQKLEERAGQLRAEHEAFQQLQTQLEARQREIDEQQTGLEHHRTELDRRESDLTSREEDLGRRWDELSSQQTQYETQKRSLDDRQADLERLQQELNQCETDLTSREEELGQQRQEFSSQQTQHEDLRRSLDGRQADLENRLQELNQRETDLDGREKELREKSEECDSREAQFKTRQQALDAAEAELSSGQEDFNRQRDEFNSLRSNWEQQRKKDDAIHTERIEQFAERERELQDRLAAFDLERERIESLDSEIQVQKRKLDTQGEELQEQTAAFEAEQADLRRRVQTAEDEADEARQSSIRYQQEAAEKTGECLQLEEKLDEAHQRQEAVEAEIARQRELANSHAEEIDQLQAQLEQRNTVITDYEEKLKVVDRKLADFAATLAEQAPQLERGAAAIAMVEQQEQQIERLTRELAELKSGADPEEQQRKDQRIAELTEALRQARGQTAGGRKVAELEQRNADLAAELDRVRVELESAAISAREAREQLEQHVAKAESREADRADQDRSIAELNSEVEQLKDHLRLQEQLLEEARAAESAADSDLQERVQELESELAEARAAAASARKADGTRGTDDAEQARLKEELQQKTERIAVVVDHLRRRRRRLKRVRALLREGLPRQTLSAADRQLRFDQMRRVKEQHRELIEVREMLAASEQKMIRKWARPRAVITFAWILLLTTVVGFGSWFVTDHYFPATISASVTLEAESRTHQPLKEEDLEKWRIWHTQVLSDESFREALAQRMAERQLGQYGSTGAIGVRLDNDLTAYSGEPGSLTLTLAGKNKTETAAVLDIIATTLMQESKRQTARRSDGARAVILGARKEHGLTRYASINRLPVKDERLVYFGPVFGGVFVVSVLIICLVYARLVRAKRVFDEQGPLPDPTTDD